jgi:hypothetical protein
MPLEAEFARHCVGWVAGDASCAIQVAPLGLDSFEVVW